VLVTKYVTSDLETNWFVWTLFNLHHSLSKMSLLFFEFKGKYVFISIQNGEF